MSYAAPWTVGGCATGHHIVKKTTKGKARKQHCRKNAKRASVGRKRKSAGRKRKSAGRKRKRASAGRKRKPSAWNRHVKATAAKMKGKTFKQIIAASKKTYKKKK